ncbi:hypothetical protein Zm00014a_017788 [Zea mays]|uniref:Uncharacterized protein n=2 Tax=Zea mays TaxID=4577 RepID=A0A1D6F7M7_MAIZE|nr:hypothetical protein ZEAMMB73_Zm00001d007631 [Zea mays]PWZ40834.1 hypothetical protein Zm00014a_017788 [Zea mays]
MALLRVVSTAVLPAACCVVLLLLSTTTAPVAMAGSLRDDCRAFCRPRCEGYGADLCHALVNGFPLLQNVLEATCAERFYEVCQPICMNICTANTLTPAAGPGTAPPPPPPCGKQY